MNIFRLAGDLTHLLAIVILLFKFWKTRSCAGISGRSQILFALVYTTRYTDLFTNFVSTYNSVMKIVFIVTSYATLYLMYVKLKTTNDRNHDTFRIEFLLIPVYILALVVNHELTPFEVLWTFSIYLESVAIFPQLFLVAKTSKPDTVTSYYLGCLGSYRALYILNWAYRYYWEGYYDVIAIVAGVVQTVLFCDFFHLYIMKALISLCCVTRIFYRRWQLNFQVFLYTRGLTFLKEDDGCDKEFDGFVSFSHEDDAFAIKEIISEIERRNPNIRLCFHSRQFTSGEYLHKNMFYAVQNSKRTILILTENFLESEECLHELQIAYLQALEDHHHQIIIIKTTEVPHDVHSILKTNLDSTTCLTWGENQFWDKLLFVLPSGTCAKNRI